MTQLQTQSARQKETMNSLWLAAEFGCIRHKLENSMIFWRQRDTRTHRWRTGYNTRTSWSRNVRVATVSSIWCLVESWRTLTLWRIIVVSTAACESFVGILKRVLTSRRESVFRYTKTKVISTWFESQLTCKMLPRMRISGPEGFRRLLQHNLLFCGSLNHSSRASYYVGLLLAHPPSCQCSNVMRRKSRLQNRFSDRVLLSSPKIGRELAMCQNAVKSLLCKANDGVPELHCILEVHRWNNFPHPTLAQLPDPHYALGCRPVTCHEHPTALAAAKYMYCKSLRVNNKRWNSNEQCLLTPITCLLDCYI